MHNSVLTLISCCILIWVCTVHQGHAYGRLAGEAVTHFPSPNFGQLNPNDKWALEFKVGMLISLFAKLHCGQLTNPFI